MGLYYRGLIAYGFAVPGTEENYVLLQPHIVKDGVNVFPDVDAIREQGYSGVRQFLQTGGIIEARLPGVDIMVQYFEEKNETHLIFTLPDSAIDLEAREKLPVAVDYSYAEDAGYSELVRLAEAVNIQPGWFVYSLYS